jgi:O-methyltransferase involved in polyketide biosynthesis
MASGVSDGGSIPRIVPGLVGIPETLLWTLYARAAEASQARPVLRDPEAVRICAGLDYDFAGSFGPANRRFAVRAALIDRVITAWLRRQPDGLVVSLGEGLETQARRVDNGRMRWLTVNLPEAIRLREMFLQPTDRVRHLACDATDTAWLDALDAAPPPLMVLQGLLMYLPPEAVRHLLRTISRRLPGAELVFDVVPRDLSQATLQGLPQTPSYQLPPMPWGLDRHEIAPTLRGWGLDVRRLRFLPYRTISRYPAVVDALLDRVVPARQRQASLVHLQV